MTSLIACSQAVTMGGNKTPTPAWTNDPKGMHDSIAKIVGEIKK
jgi:hypothetical protein